MHIALSSKSFAKILMLSLVGLEDSVEILGISVGFTLKHDSMAFTAELMVASLLLIDKLRLSASCWSYLFLVK